MSLSDINELIDGDELVRDHVRARKLELIDAVFDKAIDTMRNGDLSSQSSVMKVILPMILASSKKDDEGTSDAMAMKADALAALAEIGTAIEQYGSDD